MIPKHWILLPFLLIATNIAMAADPPVSLDRAMALLRQGQRQDALHALQAIIAANPADPTQALLAAGTIDMEDGHWQAAKPLIEQLVKLRPASYLGWELMVQVQQAAGDTETRDAAIEELHTAWRDALDPSIQAQISFVRDRIIGPKHTVLAKQTLDPGGDDILRFLFQPTDEPNRPRHLIVVRSDDATNERWREDGTVSYGTVVYHLDTVELRPNGQSIARPYRFYLKPPSYDRVRAKVVQILAGTAQPLSGSPDPYWAGEPAK